MPRFRARRSLLTVSLVVLLLPACGDDDLDVETEAIKARFAAAATTAYAAEGASRAEDFQRGVDGDCFLIDDATAAELADRLEVDLEVRVGFLSGPEDDETASCPLSSADDDEQVYVGLSVSDLDRDGLLELLADPGDTLEERDVEVDGIDDDHLLVLGDNDSTQASFVRDGLRISVGGQLSDAITDESVAEVLPFVVEEVQRTLTGDGAGS